MNAKTIQQHVKFYIMNFAIN